MTPAGGPRADAARPLRQRIAAGDSARRLPLSVDDTMTHASHDTLASLGGHSMGTSWSVKLAAPRARDLHALHAAIQRQLDTVVAQMSTWGADSDLCRYNRATAGSWHALPAHFAEVMHAALAVAEASGGAFDPSVGPLVALWGFGATGGPQRVPDDAEQRAVQARCGWQRLRWREERQLLQPGGTELDLSAIAKGYAVDLVQRELRRLDVAAALVEVGGELAGYGRKPDGTPWRVLVESAPDEDAGAGLPARVVALAGRAIATSGDRWHRFDAHGQRYSHTFDPRRGRPVARAAAAVSVIASDAMHADAWATAFTVMPPEEALATAERLSLAVRLLVRGGDGLREHLSSAFAAQLDAAR